MFHPNNLRLLFWMLESLEGYFGIPVFLAQEVIGIEIMRRRKTEGDVSTFCVREILLRGHSLPTNNNVRRLAHKIPSKFRLQVLVNISRYK